jgi:hypothetical protein
MTWQKYDLIFRLCAPLHIGWRKTGNLMQTRGYVPGKNQWAALTARLTRASGRGAEGQAYVAIGEAVQRHFRFTYLYPALSVGDGYPMHYPWEADFAYLFLDSYASAALNYDSQSAEDGLLHETELIAPCTRTGDPVYLIGSLYVQNNLQSPLDQWREALGKLQLGGEQGYGWGRVALVSATPKEYSEDEPKGEVATDQKGQSYLTAHLIASNTTGVSGPIEPLIGWERNNSHGDRTWKFSNNAAICYAPGSRVTTASAFRIGPYGVWAVA